MGTTQTRVIQEEHSAAWYEGCAAAFEGNLYPDCSGMTPGEKADFDAGYLYMTQRSIIEFFPDPDSY